MRRGNTISPAPSCATTCARPERRWIPTWRAESIRVSCAVGWVSPCATHLFSALHRRRGAKSGGWRKSLSTLQLKQQEHRDEVSDKTPHVECHWVCRSGLHRSVVRLRQRVRPGATRKGPGTSGEAAGREKGPHRVPQPAAVQRA